jgi:hypothetical protein
MTQARYAAITVTSSVTITVIAARQGDEKSILNMVRIGIHSSSPKVLNP